MIPKAVEEANRPRPTIGRVVQVGPRVGPHEDNNLRPETEGGYLPIVEVGDAVMCSKYAGVDITLEGEDDFKIVSIREVICTLEVDPLTVVPVNEAPVGVSGFADLENRS